MLGQEIRVTKREGMDFPPIPKDIYHAELLDVTSQERATYDTRNNPEPEQEKETVLSFQFTLLEGKDGEQSLRGRNVWGNFIPSYLFISQKTGKNKLYKILEAFLGRELSLEEEAGGIDGNYLNALVGKHCRILIEPKTKGEKTFDNIVDWMKSNISLPALTEEEKERARIKKKIEIVDAKPEVKNAPQSIVVAPAASLEEPPMPTEAPF